LNVGFLAKQVIGISRFQLKLKKMFILVIVLITMKHYCLQDQILDQIITIINNSFDDLCMNCTPNVELKDYLKVEVGLTENNYELIEKVEYFEELQVDED